MKVALIGASGFVGKAVLDELIQRGHSVIAIARHTENIEKSEKVTAVKADVSKADEIKNAVKGADAVISTYNAGWTNPNLYSDFLEGSKLIQASVKKSGVKRLIVVGGAGSLFVADGVQLVDTPEFPKEYLAGATSARDYLTFIKTEKDLDWTFLSPAIEMHPGTSGVRKGTYRVALENPVFDGNGRSVISVEDIAVALVDEIENPKHIQQRFTVAY